MCPPFVVRQKDDPGLMEIHMCFVHDWSNVKVLKVSNRVMRMEGSEKIMKISNHFYDNDFMM